MTALLVALAVAAVVLVLAFRSIEPRMVYFPDRQIDGTPARLGWEFSDVRLRASDGVALHGWFVPATGRPITVLFLHGNAGNISHRLEKIGVYRDLGASVLLLDYRGYGRSEGRPSEAGLQRDAIAAYEQLVKDRGIAPSAIVIHGESLGSAVAAWLGSEVVSGGIVLEAAFTSARDVARAAYPGMPVEWLMSHRMETLARMPKLKAPALLLHSREDEIFPFEYAERLAAAATGGRAAVVELRGGHNDAYRVSAPVYREALASFLDALAR